ncbi:2-hydroxyacid dehydrogenase [soil metagenome]
MHQAIRNDEPVETLDHVTQPDEARLKVLVPSDLGLEIVGSSERIEAVRYQPGEPWPPDHVDAAVAVVDNENAAATGVRFKDLPELRLVQNLSAGYEQWLPYLPDGVALSNGRGAHGGSTAEWVVAVALAIYRELLQFNDCQVQGVWKPSDTETLIGKRVVVLGAGDLAVNLRDRLTPFETEVILVGTHARQGVRALEDIDEVLPDTDIVVSMLPGGDATRHIINAEFLAKLRDGAIVVNAGRGGAVDADALLGELNSGRLRAALDVTDPEPLPPGHPLWSAPGLLLTPHVAGSTTGAKERAWSVALAQIETYADGGVPPNLVAGPGSGSGW